MKLKKGSKHKLTRERTMMRGIMQGKMPKLSQIMAGPIDVNEAVKAVTKGMRGARK